MRAPNNENDIVKDFSVFKWHVFLPGETSVDDIAVMKWYGNLANYMPEHFFAPTYSIQIVTKGSITISINNLSYEVEPNGGYFISPDFLLRRPPIDDAYAEIYVVALSRKFLQDMNLHIKLAEMAQIYAHPVWRMSEHKTKRVVQFMEFLRDIITDKNRPATMMLVHSLFTYLSSDEEGRYKNVEITLSRDEEITGKFLALVDEYCEKQHGLDWYASELCLSTRYVANTVKQTLGITASSCIERALTQRANTLLCTTTMSIQEIADQLGFQNQSHFGTFFKRHEGVSPAAFRKQQ